MLPTFVIGLREGLEAALIVGIIAAFLRKQGRDDLLRQMALGVGAAVMICTLGGLALEIWSRNLPQKQQEGLETVIGVLAVGMVTYMVVWMKEHARGLKAELESMAADAIGTTSSKAGTAMVVMAFLAVMREGFETVVFLLAAFNESGSGASAVVGAILGIVIAVLLGYGIYRGGVRINLSKFFRATGLVLVLVAGGLVVSALHTAHEAGWLNTGQHQLLDLSAVVKPGSVLASLLTGMLGVQPFPVLAECLGWLLYVIPVGVFVAWAPGRAVPLLALRRGLAATAVIGIGAGIVLAASAPTAATSYTTRDGALTARVVAQHGNDIVLRTQTRQPLAGTVGRTTDLTLSRSDVGADVYAVTTSAPGTGPASISTVTLAGLNGGRLPLGVQVRPTDDHVNVRYVDQLTLTATVEARTGFVVDLTWKQDRQVVAAGSSGQDVALGKPIGSRTITLSPAAVRAADAAVQHSADTASTRAGRIALAWLLGILGAAAGLGLAASVALQRPAEPVPAPQRKQTALVS
ncbi:MAG: iron permease [Marmoricola sp.]|nr:iron permease [Marmoricola sp.]